MDITLLQQVHHHHTNPTPGFKIHLVLSSAARSFPFSLHLLHENFSTPMDINVLPTQQTESSQNISTIQDKFTAGSDVGDIP